MNPLTFFPVSWLPAAVVCFAIVAVICGWRLLRSPRPSALPVRLRFGLWLLRVVIASLLLACILDFHRESRRESVEKPMLGVMIDRSASMAVADAPGGRSRFDAARDHATHDIPEIWGGTQRLELAFAGSGLSNGDPATVHADEPRSALGKSLTEMLERQDQRPLDALVLLTDGAASDESQVRAAAKLYSEARVPVYPWVTGTGKQPADLRIAAASLKQPSPSKAVVHLDLALDSPGCEGRDTTLTIAFDKQTLHQQTIHLTGKRQTFGIDFDCPYRGLQFYNVELSPAGDEAFLDNNHARLACDLKRDPIRVMYMEGSDPSEVKYLREALEADPEMEIDCMDSHLDGGGYFYDGKSLVQSRGNSQVINDQNGRRISGVQHPVYGYPKNLEGLLHYDVIINSDISKELFTEEQLVNTVDFVEKHGGGFVMVGGNTSFGAGSYEKTVIDKLMPVEIAPGYDFISYPFTAKVTEVGWTHPIMQVGADSAETEAAWNRCFPPFYGANAALRSKPGAHVIARTQSSQKEEDGLVLFAVQEIGKGRTMAFMSDTTEAWGTSFETIWGPTRRDSAYYRKFWNNTIRWLAADRIARKGGDAVIGLPDNPVAVGDTVNIRVASASSGDLAGLVVTFKQGDESEAPLPLHWDARSRDWNGVMTVHTPGELRFTAKYSSAEGKPVTALAGLEVREKNDESVAVATRPDLLGELAKATGGKVLTDDNAGQVLREIASHSVNTVWKGATPVWDRWWIMLPLLATAGAEWYLRRRAMV